MRKKGYETVESNNLHFNNIPPRKILNVLCFQSVSDVVEQLNKWGIDHTMLIFDESSGLIFKDRIGITLIYYKDGMYHFSRLGKNLLDKIRDGKYVPSKIYTGVLIGEIVEPTKEVLLKVMSKKDK